MADQHQLEVLKQGPGIWNTWRQQHPTTQPDLRGANLRGANLIGADLSEVDLSLANLSLANLIGANLRGANLGIANLSLANPSSASLSPFSLSLPSLSLFDPSSVLPSSTNLSYANLSYADLSGAKVELTQFDNIDLRTVRGLETVEHRGPSSIGIDTIYRSQGRIPEVFLRKAGVPEDFIIYMRSLVTIEYYTCFISYSSHDQEFVNQLYTDLQSKGVRCWYAPEDMRTGDKIRQRIDDSIRLYDKLLVVLSEHSIASSWVEFEVEAALAKEDEKHALVLFPVRLDDAVMHTTSWAAHIKRMRHITDFTGWNQHDNYQKALTRLLRDLNATTPPKETTT